MKNYFFVELITVSAIVAVGALLAMLGGCDEAKMMNPVMDEVMGPEKDTTPKTAGEMKKEEETPEPEETADAAKESKDITPPVVTEVQYYRDRQLTELVTEAVHPGDTIYTKVVFSEPVRQVIADDNTSRPALFVVIDGRAVRYRVKTVNDELESGDCRPMNGTDVYLCRYTVPEDTSGTVALKVGGATADEAGNRVAESSVHTAPFVIEKPEPVIDDIEWDVDPGTIVPAEWLANPIAPNEEYLKAIQTRYDLIGGSSVTEPKPQTKVGYPADRISLLPLELRETAYAGFVATVDLPYFAEAAEVMKEANLALIIANAESLKRNDDLAYYREVRRRVNDERGVTEDNKTRVESIYFEENPAEVKYCFTDSRDWCSRFWFILEYIRLSLQYPNAEKQELYDHFRISVQEGYIQGLDNPFS